MTPPPDPATTTLYLALGSLATYRLSLLVSKEDGPAFIFRKLRKMPPAKSSAREGIACVFCVSMWASIAVTTYLWWLGVLPGIEWPLWWLAQSALAIACNQLWTKGP
jgi:hypothetical protein